MNAHIAASIMAAIIWAPAAHAAQPDFMYWDCDGPAVSADAPLRLRVYEANVVDVYDGDTITADVRLGLGIWAKGVKVRLLGIDAPEMRGDEQPLGILARDALRAMVLGKTVALETIDDKTGKFGRLLGRIRINGKDAAAELVSQGLATIKHY